MASPTPALLRAVRPTSARNVTPPPFNVLVPHPRSQAANGTALLNEARKLILDGAVHTGMELLVSGLGEHRRLTLGQEWTRFASAALEHPVRELAHQDPFTRRTFDKPRGYAGDALMLDYIYREVPLPSDTTEMGRAIYSYTSASPACQSVRCRRDILAEAIDEVAARTPAGARVLSIACGHLREAQRSEAVKAGALSTFVGLDQDEESLALLGREHVQLGVTPVAGSVRDILGARVAYRDMDLVYAAGLYDYLPPPVATRLTARLFAMLRSGGRLLVGNFCPNLHDIGYMESYMAWTLLYRTEADMEALAAEVPAGEIAGRRLFRDGPGNVVYLELQRQ